MNNLDSEVIAQFKTIAELMGYSCLFHFDEDSVMNGTPLEEGDLEGVIIGTAEFIVGIKAALYEGNELPELEG